MSDINDQSVDQSDDLDVFSDEFFGRKSQEDIQNDSDDEQAKPVEQDTEDDDQEDAPEKVEDDHPDDAEDEQEDVEETKPKARAKDRIVELNTKFREAERREQAALQRIAELEKTLKPTDDQPRTEQKSQEGPSPTDTNDDGSEKYPLGEFDPSFIRDLTRFTIAQERAEAEKTSQADRQRQEQERQQATLNQEWEEKLTPARERYPDFQEKAESLVDVFSGLDEQYGEFLAQTIMSMDNGTDVLYYLSNNHDEAEKIVKAGATKAAIALGRISLKVEEPVQEAPKQRVSKAPTPPPTNKGSSASKPVVSDDTDDLEAFEKKFFVRRK